MKYIYSLFLCALLFSACDKIEAEKVVFDVTHGAAEYHVGDTVTFNFSGNPDNITFYSGQDGSNYEHRARTIAEGTPQLSFTSFMQFGAQVNTLRLLASTDFNGAVDANIASNGTWADITPKAALSTGSDNTPSGIIDLSEYLAAKKPLYLAFKFVGTTGTTQRTWTIKDFTINNVLTSGSILPVTTISDAGWQQISIKNPAVVWTNNATQIRIAGGAATVADNEDWIVTKPLNLSSVQPDAGVALKNITTRMDSYRYVYTKPGTYVATFVASNATIDSQETVLKQVKVVILP